MTSTASADLISKAKAGDRFAFDELVGPLVDQAYRLAYGMLHDREAAQDAVQEATMRSWRRLGNLRPGTDMRPWFLAIVANQCRNIARGSWWSVLRIDVAPAAPADDIENQVASGADLRRALNKLAPEQREAIVLHYYLDLPLQEVAGIAGVPVGTVKSRINRGIAALRPFFLPMEALV
ncbi:MAG TPA: RNA polymerase sigma factor [Candidatus Limnocylindrales bacterium]|nr:RNA polymerase sigma factor [Candidatus Limnocylindrales bacterium]